MKTNKEMQEICDHSEDYCPIDNNMKLQGEVNNNTKYIVDCSTSIDGKNESEMTCIYDRNGKNNYKIIVKNWW